MTNIYIHCKIQSNDCRIQSVFDHCLGIASKYGNKCKQQNSTKKYPFWSLPSVQIADYRTVTPDFHRSKHNDDQKYSKIITPDSFSKCQQSTHDHRQDPWMMIVQRHSSQKYIQLPKSICRDRTWEKCQDKRCPSNDHRYLCQAEPHYFFLSGRDTPAGLSEKLHLRNPPEISDSHITDNIKSYKASG